MDFKTQDVTNIAALPAPLVAYFSKMCNAVRMRVRAGEAMSFNQDIDTIHTGHARHH